MDALRMCLKVGIAVGLAYLFTAGDRNLYALYTVLTAALVVGESLGEDLGQSLVRVVGTVLGAVIGIAAGLVAGTAWWVVVLAAVASVLVSRYIKLEQLGRATVAVCLVTLLLHQSDAKDYAVYRLLNTFIGAAVGLGVSVFVWPVRAADVSAKLRRQLLEVSADLLDDVAGRRKPDKDPPQEAAVPLLAKAFKALKDARREEQWQFRVDPTHHEAVILTTQIGVGAMSVASNVARLEKNPAAVPHFAAARAAAAALGERARALADPDAAQVVPQVAVPDIPRPDPTAPELSDVDCLLIAAVVGELRVIGVALTVLERMAVARPRVTPPPPASPEKSSTAAAPAAAP
jgi:uncharacterized membrane protein YccC